MAQRRKGVIAEFLRGLDFMVPLPGGIKGIAVNLGDVL